MGLLMGSYLVSRSNCIDIGASHGDILKEMVKLSPDGRHLAFEPVPDLYESLVKAYPTVDVRRMALSNESGESAFNWVPQQDGLSGLVKSKYDLVPTGEQITVRTERLDDVLPPDYEPSLIKIDVEGGEFEVLQGGYQTLEKFRPLLIIEYPARTQPGVTRGDLYDLLVGKIGYRVFDLLGNGPLSRAQLTRSEGLNFVFRP